MWISYSHRLCSADQTVLSLSLSLACLPQRREALGLPPGDTDPTFEEFSDEEYVHLEDPPELVEARNRLAAYTYRQGEEEPAGGVGAVVLQTC